jgi:hypothetical protein
MKIRFIEETLLMSKCNICCFSGRSSPFSKVAKANEVLEVFGVQQEPRATKRKPRHRDKDKVLYTIFLPAATLHPDRFEHVPKRVFEVIEEDDGLHDTDN